MLKSFFALRVVRYLSVSLIVTCFDYLITVTLARLDIFLVVSNTAGLIGGSLLQFVILYRYVYKLPMTRTAFFTFESTFCIGWVLSTLIILIAYSTFGFTVQVSKVLSIVITFFLIYSLREYTVRKAVKYDC